MKEQTTAPGRSPGRGISPQREQMMAFHLSLLQPVIHEPLCTLVPFGGSWGWLVAPAVPRHSRRKRRLVPGVCGSGAGTAPGAAPGSIPGHTELPAEMAVKEGQPGMSCCRCQGCRQDGHLPVPAHMESTGTFQWAQLSSAPQPLLDSPLPARMETVLQWAQLCQAATAALTPA